MKQTYAAKDPQDKESRESGTDKRAEDMAEASAFLDHRDRFLQRDCARVDRGWTEGARIYSQESRKSTARSIDIHARR